MDEYDPLTYENLAASVVGALLRRPLEPLPPPKPVEGAGVYAIYYKGSFQAYARIATGQGRVPIYVGKAVPRGSRKGGESEISGALWSRLRQHAESIKQTRNLRLEGFLCRYLTVKPVWITLAERFLIASFRPVWNVVIDGFGNHAPGKGRGAMIRPKWDTLHPGRPWAGKLKQAFTVDGILSSVREHFAAAEGLSATQASDRP